MINRNLLSFNTIGTVEPLQKYIAGRLYLKKINVCLFVHGILYDPIGYYQIFSKIDKRSPNVSDPIIDNAYLSILKGNPDYRLNKKVSLISIDYSPLSKIINNNKSILLFSSSYEPGMPILTPNTLMDLISKIIKIRGSMKNIKLRLHPGESKFYFNNLIFKFFNEKIKFDLNNNEKFDIGLGLPSTYINDAKLRCNKVFLYGNYSYFPKDFNSEYVF